MNKPLTMRSAEPFLIPGGRTGCLLIHGFTGTPKEMRMLADSLSMEGFTILAPRLFGHASDPHDMNRARCTDWIASVEDGMNLLKGCTDQQYVMGLSMGGILALITAARHKFKGVVTFSAPCSLPPDPRKIFLRMITWLNPRVSKGQPDWQNSAAMQDHVDYPYYQARPILQLERLIQVMREELHEVKIPTLLVQSKIDRGIPVNSMDYIYENISSTDKFRLWVENSGHVVIREPDREEIFSAVKTFLARVNHI